MNIVYRMKEIHPLYISVIIFIVCLMGAFVTFGILESSGVVQDERIQLGGSVAGFLVIFIALSNFYKSQMEKVRDEKVRKLTEELEKEKKPLTILLEFNPDDLNEDEVVRNLKFEKCTLNISENEFDEKKESSNIILTKGGDEAWTFKLPNFTPDSIAGLEIVDIVDDEERKWEVAPFRLYAPYQMTQKVMKR